MWVPFSDCCASHSQALSVPYFVLLAWRSFKGHHFNDLSFENCYLHTCLCTHSNTPCLPSCPCCRLHKGRDSDCWALFLMSLVPTTQCLSVVASYNGHVIGTSLGKRKLVITSLLYTLWCNNSRRRLLRVRQICLLDNGLHLPSSPSLIGGGRLCTINRCETNKTPLSFPDGISNTPLSYWPYLAMLTK